MVVSGVACHVCGTNNGYYEHGGKDYLFRCAYCGTAHSNEGTETPAAVIDLLHGDGTADCIIISDKSLLAGAIKQVRAYRYMLRRVVVRVVVNGNVVENTLYRDGGIRSCIAKVISAYEWITRLSCHIVNWTCRAKVKQ